MIDIGDAGRNLLETSHAGQYIVQAYYGNTMTLADVPIDPKQSSLTFSADSATQGTGTVYVVSNGASLRPKTKTDPLAAYGQELAITYVSGNRLTIPMGRFRITDVPSSQEFRRLNPFVPMGSITQLTLADRFDFLQHDTFLSRTSPQSSSAWAEIQRISPIPFVKAGSDATVPSNLVYQSKMDAITQLAALSGQEPAMTRAGALTLRRSASWTLGLAPVTTIHGTVSRDDGMSNSLINYVVVTNSSKPTIVGTAAITASNDPLRVNGPLGRRVATLTSTTATTNAKATAEAAAYLAKVSTRQTATAAITCLPRPDIELGDFIAVVDPLTNETLKGTVTAMTFPLDPTKTMSLTLTMQES